MMIENRTICKYVDLMRILESLIKYEFNNKIKLVAAYPTESDVESIDLPLITYKLRRKEPGMFGPNREIKPRMRDELSLGSVVPKFDKDGAAFGFKDKDGNVIKLQGGTVELWGQMFDYYVTFEIWADNNKLVDQWADELEGFLFKYTGYLKNRGVSEMIYQFREEGLQKDKWKAELKSTNIEYLFRIDEVLGVKVSEVEQILMEVEVVDATTQTVENMVYEYVGMSKEPYNSDVIRYTVSNDI